MPNDLGIHFDNGQVVHAPVDLWVLAIFHALTAEQRQVALTALEMLRGTGVTLHRPTPNGVAAVPLRQWIPTVPKA